MKDKLTFYDIAMYALTPLFLVVFGLEWVAEKVQDLLDGRH